MVNRVKMLEEELRGMAIRADVAEAERDEALARAETAERERDAWRSEADSVRRMYEAARDRERALLEVVPDGPPDGHDVNARAGTVWLDSIDHTPDEAVDLARALLAAAEEVRDGADR